MRWGYVGRLGDYQANVLPIHRHGPQAAIGQGLGRKHDGLHAGACRGGGVCGTVAANAPSGPAAAPSALSTLPSTALAAAALTTTTLTATALTTAALASIDCRLCRVETSFASVHSAELYICGLDLAVGYARARMRARNRHRCAP